MYIRCPNCKKEYGVTLFEFGKEILCDCGMKIGLQHNEVINRLDEILKNYNLELEEEKLSRK